jgi:hypothetical protein
MIQRIQSLYLLLVIILSSVTLYFSLTNNFEIELNFWFYKFYGFYIIPIFGFLSLLFYSKRKVQSILCLLLILFNIIVITFYVLKVFQGNINRIILIVVGVSFLESVLLILARIAIDKDEKLVRSIDRIR